MLQRLLLDLSLCPSTPHPAPPCPAPARLTLCPPTGAPHAGQRPGAALPQRLLRQDCGAAQPGGAEPQVGWWKGGWGWLSVVGAAGCRESRWLSWRRCPAGSVVAGWRDKQNIGACLPTLLQPASQPANQLPSLLVHVWYVIFSSQPAYGCSLRLPHAGTGRAMPSLRSGSCANN